MKKALEIDHPLANKDKVECDYFMIHYWLFRKPGIRKISTEFSL